MKTIDKKQIKNIKKNYINNGKVKDCIFIDFSAKDFNNINFSSVTFENCKFINVEFPNDSTFDNVYFNDCKFEKIKFKYGNYFEEVDIEGYDFTRCVISLKILDNLSSFFVNQLVNCEINIRGNYYGSINKTNNDNNFKKITEHHWDENIFKDCNFSEIVFDKCYMTYCEFHNCNFRSIEFINTTICSLSFYECELSKFISSGTEKNMNSKNYLFETIYLSCSFNSCDFKNNIILFDVSFSKCDFNYATKFSNKYFDRINALSDNERNFLIDKGLLDDKNSKLFYILNSYQNMYHDLYINYLNTSIKDVGYSMYFESKKMNLLKKKQIYKTEKSYENLKQYLLEKIFYISCGFGEKPSWALKNAFILLMFFSFYYMITGIEDNINSNHIFYLNVIQNFKFSMVTRDNMIHLFKDYLISLYFSVISFTTIGYGDYSPMTFLSKIGVMIQGGLSVILVSLFTTSFIRKILK